MTHAEKAKALFMQGYNCSQAVFAAFCDLTGLSEQQAAHIASGFGGGMGGMREVCGTVSGMVLVLSTRYGGYAPQQRQQKAALYHAIQAVSARFQEENGSIICRDLLGLNRDVRAMEPSERTAEYYKKRPCPELCALAAQIVDDFIAQHPEGI